tara:strand:+ start:193 stop:687 length:495 start_codon:yes stop_codon:yes gene_type:complete
MSNDIDIKGDYNRIMRRLKESLDNMSLSLKELDEHNRDMARYNAHWKSNCMMLQGFREDAEKLGKWANIRYGALMYDDYIELHLDENGKVALVESGMDCDGVEYANEVTVVDSNKTLDAIDDKAEWADGPMHFSIMRVSDAEKLKPYKRDRNTRAFEDGHPHCI